MSQPSEKTATTRIWDIFVRMFHWSLVAGIGVAAWTGFIIGPRALDIHVWIGSLAGALVFLRLIWGFTGGTFARFSSFLTGPRQTIHHLRELADKTAPRHLGHNPLGGWMVLALLGVIAGLAATGAYVLGGTFHAGPLAGWVSTSSGMGLRELHEVLAILLLVFIAFHLAGVIFESYRTRENLARAMVTGSKEMRSGDEPQTRLAARPLAFVLTGVFGLGLAVFSGLSMSHRTPPNAPVSVVGTTYEANCTDCHMAYHPSLLPASSWVQIMATLDDHFGEDAWLPPDTVTEISAWLGAHSGEATDSKPALVFSQLNSARPMEITETPFWKRTHAHLPEDMFTTPPVYARGNCAACHEDTKTGWFYPPNIHLPE